MSPRIIADYYTKVLNGYSNNILAATDLATKLTPLNIESIKQMNKWVKTDGPGDNGLEVWRSPGPPIYVYKSSN